MSCVGQNKAIGVWFESCRVDLEQGKAVESLDEFPVAHIVIETGPRRKEGN